jgi:cytochrome o ubiquinol oxidase subunit 3
MTTESATFETLSAEAEHEAANKAFGFWIYLMSDVVLFAALFATFAVLSRSYAGGPTGKELFDLPHIFAETLLLLFSSATYGMVMLGMRSERRGLVGV